MPLSSSPPWEDGEAAVSWITGLLQGNKSWCFRPGGGVQEEALLQSLQRGQRLEGAEVEIRSRLRGDSRGQDGVVDFRLKLAESRGRW